jgi:hypothetical protein
MTVYQLRDRQDGLVYYAVLVIFFGALFAMSALPVLTGDAPKDEWVGRVGMFVVFVLIGCFFNAWGRRKVSEIRVADDGTVHLLRGNGRVTTVEAGEIRELEGGYSRDYDGDYTIWGFKLRTGNDEFALGEFDNLMDFVQRVQSHNPNVQITGLWPLNLPPGPPPSLYHLR